MVFVVICCLCGYAFRCSDGQSLPVDSVKTLIMVLEPEKPIIMLNAAKVIETEEHALIRGEKIFYNLTISAFTRTEANEHVHMDSNVQILVLV